MAENLNVSSTPAAAPAAQATPSAATATATAVDQAQNAVQQATAQQTPRQAPPSTKKKLQLKIDGQNETIEIDPNDEAELTRQLQLARVGQKRMQQFTEYENNVKNLFELLQKDPIKVLSDPRLGISEETRQRMAQMIINNEIQEMQKTPEQKEKERLQREYEDLKKQHENERKAREQAEFQRLQAQYTQQFDNDISDAIDKSGLPKTARTVRYFAEALMFCVQNNIDLSAKDLAPLIKKQTMSDFRDLIGSLPDDQFEDFVGKDNISRLRKRSIQKIKQVASNANQVRDTGTANKPAEKPAEKVSARDFFKNLGGAGGQKGIR
jgi:hypothetical protein